MIEYVSTRDESIKVKASKAILDGQASDGGLYVPSNLEDIKLDYHYVIEKPKQSLLQKVFSKPNFQRMAWVVWKTFFDDFDKNLLADLVKKSYDGKFDCKELTPIYYVDSALDTSILELFHGPTAAFKDVALSALPNLMSAARDLNGFTDDIMILTATSGDTGSAAIAGFADVPGTKICVFYPHGGVSDTQRLQMVTAPGKNVAACAIKGNFDDAQTAVKRLFREIPQPTEGVSLSSANSINIGRLVPQIVYYFMAYAELLNDGMIEDGDKVDFVVPTGNFGNIMAGWFAYKMGLPINKLVCASNKNDVLTEFINTGHYDRKREFHKTTSPSMDILVSSNLERLLYYVCGPERTKDYMKQLEQNGEYTITEDELKEIQSVFSAFYASDEEGAKAIKKVFENDFYVMDTHTSIAWACMEKYKAYNTLHPDGVEEAAHTVVLSTASPYKFSKSVLAPLEKHLEDVDADDLGAIGDGDRTNMLLLDVLCADAIPAGLDGIFDRPVLHEDVIEVSEMKDYVIQKCKG